MLLICDTNSRIDYEKPLSLVLVLEFLMIPPYCEICKALYSESYKMYRNSIFGMALLLASLLMPALAAPPSLCLRVHLSAESLAIANQTAAGIPAFVAAAAGADAQAESAFLAANAEATSRESALADLKRRESSEGATPELSAQIEQAEAALTAARTSLRQAEATLRTAILSAMSPPPGAVEQELLRRYANAA
jgi:hypothetical protein